MTETTTFTSLFFTLSGSGDQAPPEAVDPVDKYDAFQLLIKC